VVAIQQISNKVAIHRYLANTRRKLSRLQIITASP